MPEYTTNYNLIKPVSSDNISCVCIASDMDTIDAQLKINADATDGKLDKTGGTMTGALILFGNPVQTSEAATKGYVDNAINTAIDNAITTALSGDY